MRQRWTWWIVGVLAVTVGTLAVLIAVYLFDQRVRVSFLDVGQGDAILVSRGSSQILIDGGRDGQLLLERLGSTLPFWDRTIEMVVATHPDEDHVGGLVALSRRYAVGQWLLTDAEHDTDSWRVLRDASQEHRIAPFRGMTAKLSDETRLDILYPFADTVFDAKDTNAGSVVAKLSAGPHTFLLTGDLPMSREPDIRPGSAEVLKVGHHGSKYSTGDAWLDEVRPRDAILSVGAGNRYGHPAADVLSRLAAHNAVVYRTDKQGTITYVCSETDVPCEIQTAR